MKESKVGKGRIGIYVPDHPGASGSGYVLRYRFVMEQILGRYLDPGEHIHHINGDKTDDRPENLEILNRSDHAKKHNFGCANSRLDYEKIQALLNSGLGYKRIAKATGYNVHSVQSACRRLRLGHK